MKKNYKDLLTYIGVELALFFVLARAPFNLYAAEPPRPVPSIATTLNARVLGGINDLAKLRFMQLEREDLKEIALGRVYYVAIRDSYTTTPKPGWTPKTVDKFGAIQGWAEPAKVVAISKQGWTTTLYWTNAEIRANLRPEDFREVLRIEKVIRKSTSSTRRTLNKELLQ